MSSSNPPDGPLPALQFGDAEPIAGDTQSNSLNCLVCKLPIEATYFALGDQVICAQCKDIVTAPPQGNRFWRFIKATAFGTAAGLVGAVIWYLIRVIAHIEIGLVAILVGFMVGKAIHKASSGKGGFLYQALAVLITYCCISANYMPDIFQGIMEEVRKQPTEEIDTIVSNGRAVEQPDRADGTEALATDSPETTTEKVDTNVANASSVDPNGEPVINADNKKDDLQMQEAPKPAEFIFAVIFVSIFTLVLALATPVLVGMESPISLLIVGFALWEAWKFSAHRPLPITGPYQVTSGSNAFNSAEPSA